MSKGKINVVGYEGKVVYENTTTALRRIEVSKQLLEDIVDFKRDIMKEEFSVTDIRGFKEKGDKFSFQCGVGYNVVEKDLLKGTDGIQARLFETFSTYKKEPTLKNLESLNNSIETFKNRFPQLEKFNGYHNENKKIENNLEDEKIEIFVSKIKKEIVHNFKSNLENVDATVNISDYLQGKDFEKVILDNIEKEISDFPLTNEEVIEKYKLKDELPVIKIFTESGLAYSSDNSRTDEYAEKELYQKLETYKYAQGKRPDFNDIKEIAELVNFDKISNVKDGMQLYYENNYGDLKEYTDYDDYTDELVKEVLISKLYDKVEPLKKEIESIIEMRKNPVEIYSNEYIKEGNLENLENKYKEIVEKLEQKEEPTKQNEELEKENKKDKEREF
jgi:putative tetratricopeptide repeat-containing protein